MSKQANKTVIGAFVMVALVLVVAAVLVFGSGKIFSETQHWVMYFSGSVKGLNLGAPVQMRGVKLGSVTDVIMEFDVEKLEFRTKVYADTYGNIKPIGGAAAVDAYVAKYGGEEEIARKQMMEMLINRGMRAQLEVQSMVTGQLMVALDFFPDQPAVLMGGEPGYIEIPTIETMMEKIQETLEKLPLKEIVTDLHDAINGISEIINSPDTRKSVEDMNEAIAELKSLIATLNEQAEPIGSRVEGLVDDARTFIQNADSQLKPVAQGLEETLQDTRKLVNDIDEQVEPMSQNINNVLADSRKLVQNVDGQLENLEPHLLGAVKAAEQALLKITHTLSMLEGLAPQDSALVHELRSALKSLTDAMDSMKHLADTLERQPESLLKGK